MQSNSVANTLSTVIFIALINLFIIGLVILCLPSIKMRASFFNLRARINARKKYLLEPLKNNPTAKKYLIGYFISSFIAALSTGGQIFIMANGYPVEATIINCAAYGFTWWFSRTSKLTRNYWEQNKSGYSEFRLSSANVFWLKQILLKTILVDGMIISISLMTYMVCFGHNR
ncbi:MULTISPECIES: hypothetical protein [Lactiplantibacillus]|uniref:Uncharacterized protein n=4 Tax=Lactiplantibacillus plantarum TaxID=1590 RepID=A0A2S3U8P8_LACPN|nr:MULTISPECIES: hypothetical protein [Lactiplantibacillus]AGO09004.1 hypothetical protein Lp16_2337 [Lactiplantibacillus plantarum 16]ANJ15045.1 hypothetical protein A8704_14145 [Lactiplantibacillus plantarum]ANJ15055.1 hypothetical protein A8704_14195 [Lactiplantibacillus plantarum]APB86913.1 hypothetical protein BL295_14405 [Lactiplantibacillus plantarum]MBO2715106.1 hypothetical protein [Lactiplantibacillus plantarum]